MLPIILLLSLSAAPRPAPSTTEQAVRLAALDAARLPLEQQYTSRYFWIDDVDATHWKSLRAAFKLHINLISRNSEIIDITEITPNLWRLDLDDIKLDPAVLENAAKIDPFFHAKVTLKEDTKIASYWPGGLDPKLKKEFARGFYGVLHKKGEVVDVAAPGLPLKDINYLRKTLYTEVPILNAQWFLVQSARQINLSNKQTGLGYYDILNLKNRDDFFKLVKFNIKDSKEWYREVRSVVTKSGVSPLNRQIVRFQALGGGIWITLDVNDETGKGNAVRNLEGFKHQAEEHYAVGPNGLMYTFLCNDKGERQDFAPADGFGFTDDSVLNGSKDGRIHVNLACIRCHAGDVLKPINDYIRKTFRKGGPLALQTPVKKKQDELRRKYLSNLSAYLIKDRAVYTEAIAEATITKDYPKGMTPKEAAEAYAFVYHAYADRHLTLADAARELGITTTKWQNLLLSQTKLLGQADLYFATWLDDPPGKMSRVSWEESYQVAKAIILGKIPAVEIKK